MPASSKNKRGIDSTLLIVAGLIAEIGLALALLIWHQNSASIQHGAVPTRYAVTLLLIALVAVPLTCAVALARFRVSQAWRTLLGILGAVVAGSLVLTAFTSSTAGVGYLLIPLAALPLGVIAKSLWETK
ncbi:hypothetical protein [Streptacidiphilus fuscans]|uniref:Uncharacterized protein n=1 Tax=Streptacidiphilus fuscans TaxID=2789292 RepID=A0A931B5V6_9ACTN|nr:hypothetical protein [Streptacidiphilus fuscans]MBF9071654.1 hypothetical protein [Streptacidiphilus fuscans]MBF9072859.1 hypothetical protein [Streptacidiphilus fuscans]